MGEQKSSIEIRVHLNCQIRGEIRSITGDLIFLLKSGICIVDKGLYRMLFYQLTKMMYF